MRVLSCHGRDACVGARRQFGSRGNSGKCFESLAAGDFFLRYISSLKNVWLSYRAWLPAAAITHDQLQNCKGGLSAATAACLRFWSETVLQGPFRTGSRLVHVHLKAFTSDLDSQRATLAAKGSAVLKPCCFCMNCTPETTATMKAFERWKNMVTIALSFDRIESENVMVSGLHRAMGMSKADRELHECVLRYNFVCASIWAC